MRAASTFWRKLVRNFRGIRSACAQNDLDIRRQIVDRIHQVRNALLPRDSPYKQNIRHRRIDAVISQRPGLAGFLIFHEIDAVIDDMNAVGIDIGVGLLNISLGSLRNRNHRVGVHNCRPLHPRTHRVTAAELLGLPCAERLKRMRRQNKRNPVQLLSQKSRHRYVPCVRVDNIDSLKRFDLRQIQTESLESALEFPLGSIGNFSPRFSAAHMQIAAIRVLWSPAMDLDFNFSG